MVLWFYIYIGIKIKSGYFRVSAKHVLSVFYDRKPQEEDLAENFPSFSSQFMVDSGNVSRSDVSLQSENQRLRDLLEKERYRRKVRSICVSRGSIGIGWTSQCKRGTDCLLWSSRTSPCSQRTRGLGIFWRKKDIGGRYSNFPKFSDIHKI